MPSLVNACQSVGFVVDWDKEQFFKMAFHTLVDVGAKNCPIAFVCSTMPESPLYMGIAV